VLALPVADQRFQPLLGGITRSLSLRTVQNWEGAGEAGKTRQRRDLEELWTTLEDSSDIPAWLRSKNDAFGGNRPIELLKDGKARDIIVWVRRL